MRGLDEFAAALRAENRSHQIAHLGDHFFARHRIFGGAADSFDGFGETRSIGERYFDYRDAGGQLTLQFGVGNELYLGALLEDRRILHARLIVRGFERSCFVDQHDRDHVLHTNVGHFAIVHERGFAGGDPHRDRLHLIGFEGPPFENDLQRIERSLNRRAHGPLLDIGARYFEAFAELLD